MKFMDGKTSLSVCICDGHNTIHHVAIEWENAVEIYRLVQMCDDYSFVGHNERKGFHHFLIGLVKRQKRLRSDVHKK